MPNKGTKAKREECPYCNKITSYLVRHVNKYHPEVNHKDLYLKLHKLESYPKCLNCGKEMIPWRLDDFPKKYCSNKCQYEYIAKTGEDNMIRIRKSDYNNPAYFYVMKSDSLKRIKIGITTNLESRKHFISKDYNLNDLEIKYKFESTLYECHKLESRVIKTYTDYRMAMPKAKFGGASEWYSIEILENLIKDLESSTTIEKLTSI